MPFEIHLFVGTACISKESTSNYPVGEKHAILLFVRNEANSEYDSTTAIEIASTKGLHKIEFTRIGKLEPSRLDAEKQELYDEAMEFGSALILYSDAI